MTMETNIINRYYWLPWNQLSKEKTQFYTSHNTVLFIACKFLEEVNVWQDFQQINNHTVLLFKEVSLLDNTLEQTKQPIQSYSLSLLRSFMTWCFWKVPQFVLGGLLNDITLQRCIWFPFHLICKIC